MTENLYIIRTVEHIDALKEYLADKEFIAFDTETTGLSRDSEIIGFSVCAEEDTAFYIILTEYDPFTKTMIELGTREKSKEIIELLQGKYLIGHNALFDTMIIKERFSVDLTPSVFADTMILAHVLNENRQLGLKDLGTHYFGSSATIEQAEMKESIVRNGGTVTRAQYELYKADPDLIAKYGAKDTILTYRLFLTLVNELNASDLKDFFFDEESMPLLIGPTYQMNNTGLKIDLDALERLKQDLIEACKRDKKFVEDSIRPLVKDEYPGTNKKNTFNIGSGKQLAWLLFVKLNNDFVTLTKEGTALLRALDMKIPFSKKDKYTTLCFLKENKGKVYQEAKLNPKTKKMGRPKKIGDVQNYLAADKPVLQQLAKKYTWLTKLLEYSKNQKILHTYVEGIQNRVLDGVIYPSFLQHGTTSGRYSSRNPNFQNLPRDDKRVKKCIISREGKSFVGADYSQLEPRVFASLSQDIKLMDCFKSGDDFYSTIGSEVFEKYGLPLVKDAPGSFAELFPELRQISKVVALSSTYGTTAAKMSKAIGKDKQEAQDVIDAYFRKFPGVANFMTQSHEIVKRDGYVKSLYGRIRRIQKAKAIPSLYGTIPHKDLPYDIRNLLNLSVNHRVQSTAASIVNRASIRFLKLINAAGIIGCNIVLQVHDQVIVECFDEDAVRVKEILRDALQNTVTLPGVDLIADPFISKDLSGQK